MVEVDYTMSCVVGPWLLQYTGGQAFDSDVTVRKYAIFRRLASSPTNTDRHVIYTSE